MVPIWCHEYFLGRIGDFEQEIRWSSAMGSGLLVQGLRTACHTIDAIASRTPWIAPTKGWSASGRSGVRGLAARGLRWPPGERNSRPEHDPVRPAGPRPHGSACGTAENDGCMLLLEAWVTTQPDDSTTRPLRATIIGSVRKLTRADRLGDAVFRFLARGGGLAPPTGVHPGAVELYNTGGKRGVC
jgi:hypothetical protein